MANCNVNTHERFADIQMLRYELKGFEALSLNQKLYIYCLAKATLMGWLAMISRWEQES